MVRKRVILTACLAVLIAAGALATVGRAGAHRSSSITYIVHNAGIAYLTRTGLSRSFPGVLETGDQIFARDALFQGSRRIGYDNETCTVTFDNNDLCRAISVFTGKGAVESTWLWIDRNSSPYGPSHFTGVIAGGTGAFSQVNGQFDGTPLRDGTVRITAHLG